MKTYALTIRVPVYASNESSAIAAASEVYEQFITFLSRGIVTGDYNVPPVLEEDFTQVCEIAEVKV